MTAATLHDIIKPYGPDKIVGILSLHVDLLPPGTLTASRRAFVVDGEVWPVLCPEMVSSAAGVAACGRPVDATGSMCMDHQGEADDLS